MAITRDDAVAAGVEFYGLTRARAEFAVDELLRTGQWSTEAIFLGLRASFRCEFCDRDLLADACNYKMWERDHLVPTHAAGDDSPANLVLSCSICNVKFKGRFDPRSRTSGTDRAALLATARRHVSQCRNETEETVACIRRIVGYDARAHESA